MSYKISFGPEVVFSLVRNMLLNLETKGGG